MPAGKTSKKRKKDLFSSSSIKKVDKKLLTAALVRSRQPVLFGDSDNRKATKRRTKREIDTYVPKNSKAAKFIGNELRKDAIDRAEFKKKKIKRFFNW